MFELRNHPVKGLKYTFSDALDGNMSFLYGDKEEVIRNRKGFLKKFGVSSDQVVSMFVKQGEKIVRVSRSDAGNMFDIEKLIECDAMITREKRLALFFLVADCIPVIILDKARSILSVVHVGIVNTQAKFPMKVISLLKKKYSITPEGLEVIIGPSLQKENFFYEYFNDKNLDLWKGFVEETDDRKFMIDNVGAVIEQLKKSGVKVENIHNCGIDTYSDNHFFSHKRDYDNGVKDKGRFAVIAMFE